MSLGLSYKLGLRLQKAFFIVTSLKMREIKTRLRENSLIYFTIEGARNQVTTGYTEQSPSIPSILEGRGYYKFLFKAFIKHHFALKNTSGGGVNSSSKRKPRPIPPICVQRRELTRGGIAIHQ